jgi:hypothetical protein
MVQSLRAFGVVVTALLVVVLAVLLFMRGRNDGATATTEEACLAGLPTVVKTACGCSPHSRTIEVALRQTGSTDLARTKVVTCINSNSGITANSKNRLKGELAGCINEEKTLDEPSRNKLLEVLDNATRTPDDETQLNTWNRCYAAHIGGASSDGGRTACGLEPDSIGNWEYRERVKAMSEPDRLHLLRCAALMLQDEYHRLTDGPKRLDPGQDFSSINAWIAFLHSVDPAYGDGHYYAGEEKRWLNEDMSQEFLRSHEDFDKYLQHEKQIGSCDRDSDSSCPEKHRGYFRERTAWIRQTLASDFYRWGCMQQRQSSEQTIYFETARSFARGVLAVRDAGFIDPTQTQGLPTSVLLSSIESHSCDAARAQLQGTVETRARASQ